MSDSKQNKQEVKRTEDGKFTKGVSGNPAGRPKGSKNRLTILRQSLELALRNQAKDQMSDVMEKALEMAKEGHPGMIKLLLELHMTKGAPDEKDAKDKVSITIKADKPPKVEQHTTNIIEGKVEEDAEGNGVQTSSEADGSGDVVQTD